MPIYVGTDWIKRMYVGPVYPDWSPADFTNVQYWWRADLGVTESGGNVTAWEDQINGFTMTGVNNPQLTTDAVLNNQAVVEFNGTNNYTYTTSAPASRTGDFTLLGVYNLKALTDNSIFGVSNLSAQLRTQFQFVYFTSSGGRHALFTRRFTDTGSDLTVMETPPGTTGAKAVKGRYDSTVGQSFAALNSLTEISTAPTGNTAQDWYSSNTFCAGGFIDGTGGGNTAGFWFEGTIAEMVMIYDSPDSTEMDNWKAYVNQRYGTIIS